MTGDVETVRAALELRISNSHLSDGALLLPSNVRLDALAALARLAQERDEAQARATRAEEHRTAVIKDHLQISADLRAAEQALTQIANGGYGDASVKAHAALSRPPTVQEPA